MTELLLAGFASLVSIGCCLVVAAALGAIGFYGMRAKDRGQDR